jgi:hypothetical protein
MITTCFILWIPAGMESALELALLPCADRSVSPPQAVEITTRRSSRTTMVNLGSTEAKPPPVGLAARVEHREPGTVSTFPLETQSLCFALAS